jgi:murein DD-endopeptidase MepM/ murein hydrolase activator NlpD
MPGPVTKAEVFIPLLLPCPEPAARRETGSSPDVARPSSPSRRLKGLVLDQGLLARAGRISAALLVLSLLVLGIAALARPSFPLPEGSLLPAAASTKEVVDFDPLLEYLSPELVLSVSEADLQGLPIPKALELSTYKVKPGDSIGGVAKRFGLAVDSLVSLNGIKNIKGVKAGTELKIPNMDGLLHIVTKGQSLGSIAKAYKIDLTALADANDLGSGSIRPGQTLFIPGARLPQEALRKIYGTSVAWPGRGPISSWFGYRADPFTGVRRYHAGIDIVVNMGTPVKAAMDGVVADSGYNGNYGNYVILNHGDGLQTLYGHLSSSSVRKGQRLSQGSILGLSGNTGYSTGPHLHFGVYRGGVAVDPLKVLK